MKLLRPTSPAAGLLDRGADFDAPNGRRENLREPRPTICAGELARDIPPRASAWSAEARASALASDSAGSRRRTPSASRLPGLRPFSGVTSARRREGVALVVTLIMLAIVTLLAVAFLATTRRERAAVDVTVQQHDARQAADAARDRAISLVLARMMVTNDAMGNVLAVPPQEFSRAHLLNYDFFVSTNFDGAQFTSDGMLTTNVFTAAAIGGLSNDARVPVYLRTNLFNPLLPLDFRFYVDFNRNRTNDASDHSTNPWSPNFWGDPQWVGVLEFPGTNHSRSNRFLGRIAYMVLPAGKSLDVNYVHNDAKHAFPSNTHVLPVNGPEGFYRNHGFGNWEYNLAGFLADLNPNAWFYTNFLISPAAAPSGLAGVNDAFQSAYEIYRHRVGPTNNLDPLNFIYPEFAYDLTSTFSNVVDAYANGPLSTGAVALPIFQNDPVNFTWPGSPNTRRITEVDDFVDTARAVRYPTFQGQLRNAMTNVNPSLYDRTTLYRMISQMGTDSAVEPRERLVRNNTSHFYFSGNLVTVSNLDGHDFKVGDHVRVLGLGVGPYGNGPIGDGTFAVVRTHTNWIEYANVFPAALYNPGIVNNPFQPVSAFNPLPYGPSNVYVRVSRNNQINLNYNNLRYHETNFVPWAATNGGNIEFFHAVADRLLRAYATDPNLAGVPNYLSLTNIPIWHEPSGTNHYTAKVHQLLQLTANIYDASGKNTGGPTNTPLYPDRPTIFVPLLAPKANGPSNDVYIVGWTTNLSTVLTFSNFVDLRSPAARAAITTNNMVFGQPCVVGAKKGWPNFNEMATQGSIDISRKLGFAKLGSNDPSPSQINQWHFLGISNAVGVEIWNSYTNPFPRDLQLTLVMDTTMVLTNAAGAQLWPPGPVAASNFTLVTNIPAFTWAGAVSLPGQSAAVPNSFRVLRSNVVFLPPQSIYLHNGGVGSTFTTGNNPGNFQTNQPFYLPDWTFVATNRVRFYLFEMLGGTNRVLVDFVNLTNIERVNVLDELLAQNDNTNNPYIRPFWLTNSEVALPGNPLMSRGIRNQIECSLDPGLSPGSTYYDPNFWDYPFSTTGTLSNRPTDAGKFGAYLAVPEGNRTKQAPFNPAAVIFRKATYQANDPLVHYLVEDLRDPAPAATRTNGVILRGRVRMTEAPPTLDNLYKINDRYMPWGGNRVPMSYPLTGGFTNEFYKYRLSVKDPMVRWSDEWDFPTNKYGNVGWLGRVHRGTPWQTIYLKAGAEESNVWFGWSGNYLTHPTNDWALADLFTTSIDPASRRGLLSLNQTNVAAWSALLSGVGAQVNNAGPFFSETVYSRPVLNDAFINAFSPELYAIHTNLHGHRATNLPGGVFTRLAELLAVPAFTLHATNAANVVNSPFLGGLANPADWATNGLTDAALERLPQQLLSLVTVEENPRVVVYAWGQSLRPADNSLVISPLNPATHLLCTNYQITGEVATRSIVRFERRVNSVLGVTNLVPVVESYEVLPDP